MRELSYEYCLGYEGSVGDEDIKICTEFNLQRVH
jgi:hypothetical protein